METLEMTINDEAKHGVYAISVVSDPAMESNFIALNKQLENVKLSSLDEERRVLMGVVMIPNKLIYREDFAGRDKVNIFFSEKTVRETSELFLKNGMQGNSTLEHTLGMEGNTVVESWIKEDDVNDKSVKFGIQAPIGSWIVSMKMDDDTAFEMAKKGQLKGFSLEGLFQQVTELKEVKSKSNKMSDKTILEKVADLINGDKSEDKNKGNQIDLSKYVQAKEFEDGVVELGRVFNEKFTALQNEIDNLKSENLSLKAQIDKIPDGSHTHTSKDTKLTKQKIDGKTTKDRISQRLNNLDLSKK